MTAKAHGLDEECQSILEASGVTEDEIKLPAMGKPMTVPKPIVPTHSQNWPTKATSHTMFEEALMGKLEPGAEEPATNGMLNGDADDLLGEAEPSGAMEVADEEEDAGGWDMGEDVPVEPDGDFVHVDGPEAGTGSSEADMWSKTSPVAADHVAGGSYETAMQLLNRQVAAVNFKPLEDRFEEIYVATRTFLPANPGMPPIINFVRRTVDETDIRKIQPIIPRDLEAISGTEVQAGKTCMRNNKLEDGVKVFRRILHSLLLNAVSTQAQVAEVSLLLNRLYAGVNR